MVSLFDNLAFGFEIALRVSTLAAALAGGVLGLLCAGLPRVAIVALLALLLPVVQRLDAAAGLILLAGFVCAAHHGRPPRLVRPAASALPAVALGMPAQPPAVPVVLLIAALVGGLAIALFAPPLTELAYHFGPAEYVALMLFGLLAAVVLAAGSLTKSLAMLLAGLLLAQVGGAAADGGGLFAELRSPGIELDLIPIAIGSATLAAIVSVLAAPNGSGVPLAPAASPPRSTSRPRPRWRAALRASGIGSLLGVLPGATAALAPLAADAVERELRPLVQRENGARPVDPDATHAAAAAAARSGFIPLFALGVPLNGGFALLAATLLLHGKPLGPQLMTGAPELFWGVIASLLLAAPLLYLLARPLSAVAHRLAALADPAHAVLLTGFACIALLAGGQGADLWVMAAFALIGYLLFKLSCPVPPLLLGYVLGPVLEANLRHALRLSEGDWSIFVTRPLAAGLLVGAGALVAVVLLPSIRKLRAASFGDIE